MAMNVQTLCKKPYIVIGVIALTVIVILFISDLCTLCSKNRLYHYKKARNAIMMRESILRFGGHEILNDVEQFVNTHAIVNAKQLLLASQAKSSILYNSENITQSSLFRLLRSMPKGGALHVHDITAGNVEHLIDLSYHDQLWACLNERNEDIAIPNLHNPVIFEWLRFSNDEPQAIKGIGNHYCEWYRLTELRQKNGDIIDKQLRLQLALPCYQPIWENSTSDTKLQNTKCGKELQKIVHLRQNMLTYMPIWQQYISRIVEDFYHDGIQYIEFRSELPLLYDLNTTIGGQGHNYTMADTVAAMKEAVDEFMSQRPDFIGVKVIYTPKRLINEETAQTILRNAFDLKAKFPFFFAGVDPTGNIDLSTNIFEGLPLYNIVSQLIGSQMTLFIHSTKMVSYNNVLYDNIIDAVLLVPKRIGHADEIQYHPDLMYRLALYNVGVEVMPIAAQILQNHLDLHAHPSSILFADGRIPMIVSSDQPGLWNATPLTHDFCAAFVALSSPSSDLGMLRLLARNSLAYASLGENEKYSALVIWRRSWDAWINEVKNEITI